MKTDTPCDINKKIDFDCCPHCGSDFGYYQVVKSRGKWNDNTSFKGEKMNTEMMDSFFDYYLGKHYYCCQCNKKICKVK